MCSHQSTDRGSPVQRTLSLDPLAHWWRRQPCSSSDLSSIPRSLILRRVSMPASAPSTLPSLPPFLLPTGSLLSWLTLLLSVFQSGPVRTGQSCQEEASSGECARAASVALLGEVWKTKEERCFLGLTNTACVVLRYKSVAGWFGCFQPEWTRCSPAQFPKT